MIIYGGEVAVDATMATVTVILPHNLERKTQGVTLAREGESDFRGYRVGLAARGIESEQVASWWDQDSGIQSTTLDSGR